MSSAPGTPGAPPQEPSLSNVGDLLTDITSDLSLLVRQEMELAKAELRQSATQAGAGVGALAGAGVAALMMLIFVSVAAWWAIGNATGRGWSALIVALVWLLVAAGLAVYGRGRLRSVRGVPATTDTVQKIPAAVKGNEGVTR